RAAGLPRTSASLRIGQSSIFRERLTRYAAVVRSSTIARARGTNRRSTSSLMASRTPAQMQARSDRRTAERGKKGERSNEEYIIANGSWIGTSRRLCKHGPARTEEGEPDHSLLRKHGRSHQSDGGR